jgi:hypothetical protein
MPALVMRYAIGGPDIEKLAQIFLEIGGRGGLERTAQMLGCHRETLSRGLRRGTFGTAVGRKIIDGVKQKYPEVESMMVFKCR